jgi:CubicO group peptidase (beta-lactamase class C family)
MHTNFSRHFNICILSFIVSTTFTIESRSAGQSFTGESYDWPVSSPEAQGLKGDVLRSAFDEAEKKSYMYSLLVVKNGYLVAEAYYHGRNKNTLDLIFSATKSVTSALIGIAVQEGRIDSLDQKMMDFFPEYDTPDLDPRKKEITIRHLLTMQSGFEDEAHIGEKVDTASNMITAIITSELRFDPGTDFLYSTDGSHLLSAILARAAGMSTLNYAVKKLFKPLGIRSVYWASNKNGITYGGSGLCLTPRNMARFGYLYLEKGLVDQQQIVPADWIALSVQNHRSYREPWKEMDDVGYGFQWWTGRFGNYPVYFASGFGGQWILNIPDLNMIIVATMNAKTEVRWQHMESLIPLVSKCILPAVFN